MPDKEELGELKETIVKLVINTVEGRDKIKNENVKNAIRPFFLCQPHKLFHILCMSPLHVTFYKMTLLVIYSEIKKGRPAFDIDELEQIALKKVS